MLEISNMDALPPNDPNSNGSNNNSGYRAKEVPHDGSPREQSEITNGEMDVIGDLSDSPMVVVMFLMGVAVWFLRERCVC